MCCGKDRAPCGQAGTPSRELPFLGRTLWRIGSTLTANPAQGANVWASLAGTLRVHSLGTGLAPRAPRSPTRMSPRSAPTATGLLPSPTQPRQGRRWCAPRQATTRTQCLWFVSVTSRRALDAAGVRLCSSAGIAIRCPPGCNIRDTQEPTLYQGFACHVPPVHALQSQGAGSKFDLALRCPAPVLTFRLRPCARPRSPRSTRPLWLETTGSERCEGPVGCELPCWSAGGNASWQRRRRAGSRHVDRTGGTGQGVKKNPRRHVGPGGSNCL